MIEYFKNVDSGHIVSVSTGSGMVEIPEEEYTDILNAIKTRPVPPHGFDFALRADTLEWELVELPPEPIDPELDDAEALEILLGGAGE